MRHCSSCIKCKRDPFTKYLKEEIYECKKDGHIIVYPFLEGLRCKSYVKEKTTFRDYFNER